MASNINPYSIDGTFPVANQDNSSQGFRDNFTNTKNNFLYAQAEISDLQSKAILTSALTGQTLSNDMGGTQIRRPQLAAWTQTLLDNGAVAGAITLDFNQANFQKLTTGASISINFTNWPSLVSGSTGASGYGIMRIWINVTNKNHTVTLPASVHIADDSLANYNGAGTISFDAAGNYLFDISSIDGGASYIIQDLTRNRAQFSDTNFYYNIQASPTMYIGFGGGSLNQSNTAVTGYFSQGLTNIQAYDGGEDMIATFGSINSWSVGNLSLANVSHTQIDTGSIAGMSVTGARGNLLTVGAQPVHSNDIIGYFNAQAFTGNGTGNAFQQTAGVYFYATGSNVVSGLGSNIAFFTVPDGGHATNTINKAVSIENDMTMQVNGVLQTASGRIDAGIVVANMAVSNVVTITSNISTLVLDNTNSTGYISPVTILLPTSPINGHQLRISAAAPITNANIYPGAGKTVKWVAQTDFNFGNVAATLTYVSAYSTWYRS
ncbi:MAG TPA: hypothetical protein VFM18_18375 [Methanosarcina sp.]|nr:hypothetical protein [Methanosarcina sp.]